MSLNYSFAGKKVLITGGGQGIGRQLVQRFHDDGATVFTIDKNAKSIEKLNKELPKVIAKVVDLADWEETRKVVQSFGVIDHLVNNAGMMIMEKFMDVTKEAADLQFRVNVSAMINVGQVVAKGLIDAGREGSILNVSSMASRVGNKAIGVSVYSAAKAAVENLTKSMGLELGAHKIRVNCILPGLTDTPMLVDIDEEADDFAEKHVLSRMIFKRMILPNEIADLVMFLLSPLSSMIVGQGVVIDGGFLAS